MAKNKGGSYTPPTRAEIEAMRAEKMQLVPNGEAGRRERKLLEHYSAAQADLQWIVDNNAWHELGFDTFTGWYTARVRPAVAAAGLRPTQEFALYVLENVQADEAKLPKRQRLLQRELADLVGVSVSTLRRLFQDPPQASNGAGADLEDPAPGDVSAALTEAIRETAAHTSGAVPPASTEDASPVLGEPDVDEQAASTSGTQDSPAADSLPPQAHAGVPAVGGQTEERDEEEAVEPPVDTPAAGVTSLPDGDGDPTPEPEQQPGHNSPTGIEGSRSEAISPTGQDSELPEGSAVATAGRSETDDDLLRRINEEFADSLDAAVNGHHDGAGVSRRGEALPVESRPVGALLEDGGTAQDPPSSSDPVVIRASVEDMIGTVERLEVPREEWDSWTPAQRRAHIDNFGAEVMNNCGGYGAGIESGAPVSDLEDEPLAEPTPTDRLLASVDALINLVDELDVEAVASMLFPAELERLHQHSEALAAFVAKVSRIRFEALTRTP